MTAAGTSTLADLAARQADTELSENGVANVAETMRLLSAAQERIERAQGALNRSRVGFDQKPFAEALGALDRAWMALQPAMLAHVNALDAKAGRA